MNKVYIAQIKWINVNRIKYSFFNNKYGPLLCVDGNIFINGSSWSIICFSYQLINECTTYSALWFLNQNVSKLTDNILNIDDDFKLLEGNKVIAQGKIIKIYKNLN